MLDSGAGCDQRLLRRQLFGQGRLGLAFDFNAHAAGGSSIMRMA